jgi:predicted MPP superfamily phosphohydrolase
MATAGSGLRHSTADLATPEVAVRLARLPRALSGYRIALLSDLHVGPMLGRRFVEHVVAETNALRPDLVAIAGDLVDGSVRRVGPKLEPLTRLRARDGVFFVTGNHEYYAGVAPWLPFLRSLGIRVLANERVVVGDGATVFDLAGVHDWHGGWKRGYGPDLARALAGRNPDRELVLLAHQPAQIREAAEAGVGLQLSGHTMAVRSGPWVP